MLIKGKCNIYYIKTVVVVVGIVDKWKVVPTYAYSELLI